MNTITDSTKKSTKAATPRASESDVEERAAEVAELRGELAGIDLGSADVDLYDGRITDADFVRLRERHAGLVAKIGVAERRLEEAQTREREQRAAATSVEHKAVAKMHDLRARENFTRECVAEALDLEAKFVGLYARIEERVDEATRARERIESEARAIGADAPAVPVWTEGIVHSAIGEAIHDAHLARTPAPPPNMPPHVRQMAAQQVPAQAERAREMIAPYRGL